MKSNKISILTLFAIALLLGSGCRTAPVVPDRVDVAEHISYDPTDTAEPTNGILAENDEEGWTLITENARSRYNRLIDRYGKAFTVRIRKDYGITPAETPGQYYLNNAGMEAWYTMSKWLDMGKEGS